MFEQEKAYALQAQGGSLGQTALMPSMRDRIKAAVQQAEDRLKDVRRAAEIFDGHPELEELLNIMQRSHF